jgi:hypothetical protein
MSGESAVNFLGTRVAAAPIGADAMSLGLEPQDNCLDSVGYVGAAGSGPQDVSTNDFGG